MSNHKPRGQFRNMSMPDLQEASQLDIWLAEEFSSLQYVYPINLSAEEAILAGQSLSQDIPADQLRKVGHYLTAASPQSHIGPFLHAIDFLVPDGTPILATHDGMITEAFDWHSTWGDGPEFRDKLNRVTIEHYDPDNKREFSQYCHLARRSIRDLGLEVGSMVKAGQQIATVGKTGWTDRDHLHFIVFRLDRSCAENPFGFRSLKIRFF